MKMDEKELLQAAMHNSYNVITHKCTIEEVEDDGMPVFVHFPDRDIDKTSIKVMVMYFIMMEEYEKCADLNHVYELLFDEKMPSLLCKCDIPQYHLREDDVIECQKCKTEVI